MRIKNNRLYKTKRDSEISFSSYSFFAKRYKAIYGNRHKGAQIAYDYWLALRQNAIQEVLHIFTTEEIKFLLKLYIEIATKSIYSELLSYFCLFGFVYVLGHMKSSWDELFELFIDSDLIDPKTIRSKLYDLTPIQAFFLEDICWTFPEELSIEEYIDKLKVIDKEIRLKVGRYY